MPESRDDLFVYGRDSAIARRHFAARQRGACAICGRVSVLVLDHEHSEEALCRGLLCIACNAGLGFFADERLTAAAVYLREHRDRTDSYQATADWAARRTKRSSLTQVEIEFARSSRDEDVLRAARDGANAQEIASRFGISVRTVYRIVEAASE